MSENTSEHLPSDIELLLPFFVNGTLDDDERHRVEAALTADPRLAHEAAIAADLRAGIRDLEDPLTPGEFGLARLMRDISREPQIADESPDLQQKRAMPRFALAIAASVALVAAGLTALSQTGFFGNREAGGYHQASGSSGDGSLSVAFSATASQAQVTELLLDHDLVVVDGPSAIGIYRLAVSQDADPEIVADELRQAAGVVENVGVSE